MPSTRAFAAPDANVIARITGALWLAVIVTGALAPLLDQRSYLPADSPTTASLVLGSPVRFRLAFLATVASGAFYVGLTATLHDLMRRDLPALAAVASSFGIVGSAVYIIAALRLHEQAFLTSMIFYGCQIVSIGAWIVRSGSLPRTLGRLLVAGGSMYVVGSSFTILWPILARGIMPVIMIAAVLGEGSLAVLLLVKGIGRDPGQLVTEQNVALSL